MSIVGDDRGARDNDINPFKKIERNKREKEEKKERRKIVYEEIMYPRNNLIQSYETLTSDKIKRRNNPAEYRRG